MYHRANITSRGSSCSGNLTEFIPLRQSYALGDAHGDVTVAAKTLGELVSRKHTPITALSAAVEVKVETTVVSGDPGELLPLTESDFQWCLIQY